MVSKYDYFPGRIIISDNRIWECALIHTKLEEKRNYWFEMKLVYSSSEYIVVWHGGRVGVNARIGKTHFFEDQLDSAKLHFQYKFREKTDNEFLSDEFQYVPDLYDMVILPSEDESDAVSITQIANTKTLREDIDMKLFLYRLNYPADPLPHEVDTAKLLAFDVFSTQQLTLARKALEKISTLLANNVPDDDEDLRNASNEFYMKLPHKSRTITPIIERTSLTEKVGLLNDIYNAESTRKANEESLISQLEDFFLSNWNVHITSVSVESAEFQIVSEVLQNTQDVSYARFKLELLDVLKIDRKSENDLSFPGILLWHGSPANNFSGILRYGLKTSPGDHLRYNRFGNGIYFTDVSTKAASYCNCRARHDNNIGLLLLCNVNLGTVIPHYESEPNAHHTYRSAQEICSVKGMGYYQCPSQKMIDLHDWLPCGPLEPSSDPHTKTFKTDKIYFNEYVVYKANQVKIKYLLRVKFKSIRRV